jgi:hypothetical protein
MDMLYSLLGMAAIAGGFYMNTRSRLDRIESDIKIYTKINNEIIDRLARIETKLDFIQKK